VRTFAQRDLDDRPRETAVRRCAGGRRSLEKKREQWVGRLLLDARDIHAEPGVQPRPVEAERWISREEAGATRLRSVEDALHGDLTRRPVENRACGRVGHVVGIQPRSTSTAPALPLIRREVITWTPGCSFQVRLRSTISWA